MEFSILILLIVLVITTLGAVAYWQYKMNLKEMSQKQISVEAAVDTANVAISEGAATSPEELISNPEKAALPAGIVNRHMQSLGSKPALAEQVLTAIRHMCNNVYREVSRQTSMNGKSDLSDIGVTEVVTEEYEYSGAKFLLQYQMSNFETTRIKNDNYELSTEPTTKILDNCRINFDTTVSEEVRQKFVNLYQVFVNEYHQASIEEQPIVIGKLSSIYTIGVVNGVPQLIPQEVKQGAAIPSPVLNASYKFPDIKINTKTFCPPPMVRVDGFRRLIESGKNIALEGQNGTGKTRLLDHIAVGLPANFSLLYLHADTLSHVVANPELIKSARGVGRLAVIFDEAQFLSEERLAALLQLMDGNLTVERVSFMIGLSQEGDSALRRRVYDYVKLEQPSEGMALTLKAAIRSSHPELSMNNENGYDQLAKSGKFTIADLWNFFGPKDMVSDLVKIYQPYKPT